MRNTPWKRIAHLAYDLDMLQFENLKEIKKASGRIKDLNDLENLS
jgi:hypothetical protein